MAPATSSHRKYRLPCFEILPSRSLPPAIRLYTLANGWFLKEEDKLGSIEEGKYGDVVVLSDDYFDQRVPDVRKIHSLLTVVDGRVVHNLLGR